MREKKPVKMTDNRLKKALLIVAGFVCLAIGLVNLLVPIIPTAPFIVLGAYCFARSSQRLFHFVTTNKFFRIFINSKKDGVAVWFKFTALGLLWVSLIIAMIALKSGLWTALICTFGGIVSLVLTVSVLIQRRNSKLLEDIQDADGAQSATSDVDTIAVSEACQTGDEVADTANQPKDGKISEEKNKPADKKNDCGKLG